MYTTTQIKAMDLKTSQHTIEMIQLDNEALSNLCEKQEQDIENLVKRIEYLDGERPIMDVIEENAKVEIAISSALKEALDTKNS